MKLKKLNRGISDEQIQSHINELKASDMKVIRFVCEQLKCPIDYFFIPCRFREAVDSRHLVSLYLRKNRRYTLFAIGKIIGVVPKDHTSVLHSIKTAQNLIDTIEDYRTIYSLTLQATTTSFTSLSYRPCTN